MQLEAQVSDGQDNNDNHKNKPDGKPHTDESTRPSHGKEKLRDYRDSLYYLYQDGADVRELPVMRQGSPRFNQYKSVPHWQNGSPTQQPITVNNDIYLRSSATSTDTYHSKDRHRHPSNSQEISLPGGRTIINNSIFVDISSSSDSEAEDAGWGSNKKGGGQQREQKTRDNYNSQDAIRVLVNPQSPQDVSLSADAGITDDFEEPLEEYSRLWRLGQFEAARTLFDQCLLDLIENPYVLEQHGQCLLEMSDYNTLAQLAKEFPPRPAEGAVQTSWYLLLRRAEVSCELDFPTVSKSQSPDVLSLLRKHWPKLDSTEASREAEHVKFYS